MSKDYQLNITKTTKKRNLKSLWKISKSFQRRKRKKSNNMGMKNIKIYLKMKNKD